MREARWRRLLNTMGIDLRPGEGLPAVLLLLYFLGTIGTRT